MKEIDEVLAPPPEDSEESERRVGRALERARAEVTKRDAIEFAGWRFWATFVGMAGAIFAVFAGRHRSRHRSKTEPPSTEPADKGEK